jgi:penicillin-binding protein 1C
MNQRDGSGELNSPLGGEGSSAGGRRRAEATDSLPLSRQREEKEAKHAAWRYAAFGAAVAACIGTGALWGLIDSFGPPPPGRDVELSKTVLDRKGVLLRSYITSDGRWRLPASRAIVDPRYLDILLAYEDKRFFQHRGVDPLALLRAAYQFVRNGQIVSGGSTITMQAARLLEPRAQRSLYVKLRESVRAIQLERKLTKDQILALYLTLAPCGGNLEGIRAASLAYFGKEPQRLTLGEAALLVALPQSPELRRPDRRHEAAKRARDRVLDRMGRYGLVTSEEVARAKKEPVPTKRRSLPMVAPHAADDAMAISRGAREVKLTIDGTLQRRLERLARERAEAVGAQMSVAILAVDNGTGEVLARVGSPDYFDERRAGQVDLSRAIRSPGSALKPFIYGLGFEDGLIHPETLIEDRPRRYSGYAPENFDLTYQGTVTVRRALQQSLNVPAVAVLEEIGTSRIVARLREAGANLILPRQEAPGLALGLGGVGISLSDLTKLYAGLARQGTVAPLRELSDATVSDEAAGSKGTETRRLLDPVAAWYVARILQGTPPPDNAAGGRIAFKTGTSYGYRDAWAIGFDGGRTIGVWVGRPDGAPVVGLSGRTAAAPLLFEAFARWDEGATPLPTVPRGALVAATAKLPPPLRRFSPRTISASNFARPPSIVFPPNGASLEIASDPHGGTDPIPIKIAGGTAPLTVLANGLPLETSGATRGELLFAPDGPGFVRLTVTDSTGAADSVLVRIQ